MTGVDLPALKSELLARLRAGMAQNRGLSDALDALARTVATDFESHDAHCG
jgi:hypothetical protein